MKQPMDGMFFGQVMSLDKFKGEWPKGACGVDWRRNRNRQVALMLTLEPADRPTDAKSFDLDAALLRLWYIKAPTPEAAQVGEKRR